MPRHPHDHRSRSRSPHRSTRDRDHDDNDRRHRTRSRSPAASSRRHHHHHHHRRRHHDSKHRAPKPTQPAARPLPLGARPLSKHDYLAYKPMFALYLDIQKQKMVESLDEDEVKGRWKSFVGKWNRGELAEGWYDPATLDKAVASAAAAEFEEGYNDDAPRPKAKKRERERGSPDYDAGAAAVEKKHTAHDNNDDAGGKSEQDEEDDDSSDDDFGPAAMPEGAGGFVPAARKSGPAIPRLEDLELRNEMSAEDAAAHTTHLRALRKADRQQQKERLDELAPRAEPGSRERRLEKRAETTAAMRAFRETRSPGAEEVGENEMMGGGDGVEEFRTHKRDSDRKKNEREMRREEVLRARAAEREEKLAEHRAKEERTMEMLRALARQNFGGGRGGEE